MEKSVSGGDDEPRGGAPRALLPWPAGAGRPPAPSGLRRSLLIALCLAFGVSLLASAQALASTQRGHVFSFAFGGQGDGNGQFLDPTGVAVSNSTGDVYVADRKNNRVEEFETVANSAGEPVEEKWKTSFEVANPEGIAVDNCTNAGLACTVAEDPSVGDVYVIGASTKAVKTEPTPTDTEVLKFTPSGEVLPARKFQARVYGVAVGTSGSLFVYWSGGTGGTVSSLDDAEKNSKPSNTPVPPEGGAEPGLGVDSQGDPFIASVAKPGEAGNEALAGLEQELLEQHAPIIAKLEAGTGTVLIHALDFDASTGVAVNGFAGEEMDDVYVDNGRSIAAFGPSTHDGTPGEGEGQLLQRFSAPELEEGRGLAVDATNGTVYVADPGTDKVDAFGLEPRGGPSVAEVSATVQDESTTLRGDVNPAGEDTHYYFEYGTGSCAGSPSSCTRAPGLPADLGSGFGRHEVAIELPSLAPGLYQYRLVAESNAGEARSAEQTLVVNAPLGALPDGRAWEMVSPVKKGGAEPEALTKEGGLIQASANGDAITYVADGPMPADGEVESVRNPEFTQVLSTRNRAAGHESWESQDIDTPSTGASGTAIGKAPEYEIFSSTLALAVVDPFPSERGSFQNPQLSPALEAKGEKPGEQENTIYLRDNGPSGVLAPLATEAESYEKAHQNGGAMKNPGYLPLVTKFNEPGPNFGRNFAEQSEPLWSTGATPDLSHIVLRSEKANPGLYEWTGNEAEENTLQSVSVLPASEGGTLVSTELAGLGGTKGSFASSEDVRNAISEDGSLVVWSTFPKGGGIHLYLRDTQSKETVQLSKPGEGEAIYQTASADGSKIYFTDNEQLTTDSGATEKEPDLYVFEPEVVGGHLSGSLTDLTPQGAQGNGDVVASKVSGRVIGATETISAAEEPGEEQNANVYFVADGVLASDADRGHCPQEPALRPAGTTCNLYVKHYDGATRTWEPAKLVAALSYEDAPDWDGAIKGGNLGLMTSRVSPNGRYVTFMSNRPLTGYDNEDVSGHGRQDEEVFLYDALNERLVCASCDPTGARPRGVLDTNVPSGEGSGLVVDRPGSWATGVGSETRTQDHWLAGSVPGWTLVNLERAEYQSRYLSNQGRLFFNSADALVPLAQPTRTEKVEEHPLEVGVENVYEYEPAGLGACDQGGGCVGLISSGASPHESAFLDASESGNDVFFLTSQSLVPQDVDTNYDVYDAHVCEPSAPCPNASTPVPPPCEGEGCQGVASPEPQGSPATGTEINLGSSNLTPKTGVLSLVEGKPATGSSKPPTRAQKLAKAIKSCRTKYKKQKSKRLACEKQAKKKYGPAAKKASHSSATGSGR
jgi:DNA-binding beta-propeller fold protein YncE